MHNSVILLIIALILLMIAPTYNAQGQEPNLDPTAEQIAQGNAIFICSKKTTPSTPEFKACVKKVTPTQLAQGKAEYKKSQQARRAYQQKNTKALMTQEAYQPIPQQVEIHPQQEALERICDQVYTGTILSSPDSPSIAMGEAMKAKANCLMGYPPQQPARPVPTTTHCTTFAGTMTCTTQ